MGGPAPAEAIDRIQDVPLRVRAVHRFAGPMRISVPVYHAYTKLSMLAEADEED